MAPLDVVVDAVEIEHHSSSVLNGLSMVCSAWYLALIFKAFQLQVISSLPES